MILTYLHTLSKYKKEILDFTLVQDVTVICGFSANLDL